MFDRSKLTADKTNLGSNYPRPHRVLGPGSKRCLRVERMVMTIISSTLPFVVSSLFSCYAHRLVSFAWFPLYSTAFLILSPSRCVLSGCFPAVVKSRAKSVRGG